MKSLVFLVFFLSTLFAFAQYGPEQPILFPVDGANCVVEMDVDGDGNVDVVVASENEDFISWYRNQGGGAFDAGVTITTAVDGPKSLFVSDLDGDLDLDLLSASENDDKIAWYENLGGGNFGPQQVITTLADGACGVYAADLTNDGDIEVISISNNDNKVAWYDNLGGGTFGAQQVVSDLLNDPGYLSTADLDGDGFEDILTNRYVQFPSVAKQIYWFENLGGGFSGAYTEIGNQVDEAALVYPFDIDSDGDIDVFSSGNDVVAWYENLGTGTFASQQVITNQVDAVTSLYAEDIDGDGDKDIVSASATDNKIAWYEYLGAGAFGTQQVIAVNAQQVNSIFCSDFDGDGNIDVASAWKGSDQVVWHQNLGAGLFGAEQLLSSQAAGIRVVAAADLDGDGDIDIVHGSQIDTKIEWQENLGGGVFALPQQLTNAVNGVTAIYTKDIDNDGDVDIFSASMADDKIAWYENLGGGVFTPQQIITTQVIEPSTLYSGDIDGDGDEDLLSASAPSDDVFWHENLGNGNFGVRQVISAYIPGAKSIFAVDIDDDGDIDVLCAAEDSQEISWCENVGGSLFNARVILTNQAFGATSVVASDVDSDGDLDVVYGMNDSDGVGWIENLGNGSFSTPYIVTSSATKVRQVFTDDVDGDGDTDILASCLGNAFVWSENLGAQNFASIQIIHKPAAYVGTNITNPMFLADLDGDGDQDVVTGSNGRGGVGYHNSYLYGQIAVRGTLFADMNQNGFLDSTDIGMNQLPVLSVPQSDHTYSYSSGNYVVEFSDTMGTYNIQPDNVPHWSIITDSLTYLVTIDSTFAALDSLNFGFYPDSVVDEISVDLTSIFPRCNTLANWWLTVRNTGTTIASGVMHLELDTAMTFVSSDISPDSIVGQNIYWSYDSLLYFHQDQVNILALLPGWQNTGDTLITVYSASVIDSAGNNSLAISDTLKHELVCAYDPNDKQVTPLGIDSMGYILPSVELLEYTIRFQNTGNDTAINVVIEDQLDSDFEWQTLRPIASSDSMTVSVDQTGKATFSFPNIMLPDSTVDEPGSHGFVKYQIERKDNLPPGTVITNTANIFFDANPAVVTNTTVNTLYDCGSVVYTLSSMQLCINDTLNGLASDDISSTVFSWDVNGSQIDSSAFAWTPDTSGAYNLTITASNSLCSKDTVVQLLVIEQPQPNILDTTVICVGDSVLLFGEYQMQSGAYHDTLQTIYGCDSVLVKHLWLYPDIPVQILDTTTICSGDSVQIFGQYQSAQGVYQNVLTSVNGCDSTVAWQLELYPVIPTQMIDTSFLCIGDSALIFGQYETQVGTYYDTLSSVTSCDSVVAIQLEFYPVVPTQVVDTVTVCIGDSALIFGQYQTQSGIYYDSIQSVHGCDSVVANQLDLLQLPLINLSTFAQDTICIEDGSISLPGASPTGGTYTGTGVSGNIFDPSVSGVGSHQVYYSYTDVDGCFSMDSVEITVRICAGVEELTEDDIRVYPNPFTVYTTVQFDRPLDGSHILKVYNVLGSEVLSIDKLVGSELRIQKKDLSTGVFTMVIINRSTKRVEYTTKLIVQ